MGYPMTGVGQPMTGAEGKCGTISGAAPKQDTLMSLQQQTVGYLAKAQSMVNGLYARVHGPQPESPGCVECEPSGSLGYALDARNRARRLCEELESILNVL